MQRISPLARRIALDLGADDVDVCDAVEAEPLSEGRR
jgi:hypothetical protein